MMRVMESICMYITKDGEVVLPDTCWESNNTLFMSFAARLDPTWANSQYHRSESRPSSESSHKAVTAHFKVRKRKGEYQFSFGLRGLGTNPLFQEHPDHYKHDWTFQGIGCGHIFVHKAPPKESDQ